MKAIQSLWTKPWSINKCGWNDVEDLLTSMELSVLLLRNSKQFSEIVFYTDKLGFRLTHSLHHYFDKVIVNLNGIDWAEPYNWAFQKLFIYNQQTEPFVHIDSDVYLWDGLPQHWIDGKVNYFFQGQELMTDYPFYLEGLEEIKELVTKNHLPFMPQYAINCGVAGFVDLSIIPTYYLNAKDLIEKNQQHHWKEFAQRHHQCVLFEQLFLVPLIEGRTIEYLLDSTTKERAGVRYTHLLASSKRNKHNVWLINKTLHSLKRTKENTIQQPKIVT